MDASMSRWAAAALVAGLIGAMCSTRGGDEAPARAPEAPATPANLCAIAAGFSADPKLADEMRRAAGCPGAPPAR
jgi:hypothetical protein